MPGRRADAWSGVGKYIQCREPKTGQPNVQLSSKTKHFALLGMINLWFVQSSLVRCVKGTVSHRTEIG